MKLFPNYKSKKQLRKKIADLEMENRPYYVFSNCDSFKTNVKKLGSSITFRYPLNYIEAEFAEDKLKRQLAKKICEEIEIERIENHALGKIELRATVYILVKD